MRLTDLVSSEATPSVPSQARDPLIAGLTSDSRAVKPGFLFAALAGGKVDGAAFVAEAVAKGAVAILGAPGTKAPDGVPVIEDANPRRRLALMAARFFGRQPAHVAAVTGTNGKTSTVQFARQLWTLLGNKAASLGTLGVTAPGVEKYGSLTTPDTVSLHQVLAELADAGVDHLALEASSHGLDQYRLDGVRIEAAGFTNLSRDHLDYHGSMEAYLAAKSMLFDRVLLPGGTAVLNTDAPEFNPLSELSSRRGHRLIGYGTQAKELHVLDLTPLPHGQRLKLAVFGRVHDIHLPLAGRFQCMNALCALGLAIGAGAQPDEAASALEKLDGVRGRLELVATHPSGAPIYVDYAHTPDALETVLTALRPHARKRLVVVFGCGGDRDRGKRPVMGGLAHRLADRAIVTDDNPRTEVAAEIRREVMAGCPCSEEIGDRAAAIRAAIRELDEGDVLVIAGKGHERGQIVGTEVRPFDDADEAREALREMRV
ncbi:UDP-N-acetylmuramoylalanyl-D-glutamate--2,6-diaminopimelate ligase [Skermanella stibiiresistens SB22]|uniref:UDP-N-acetylmuramoyl-L-alanyl-D-glutamate--2,6-diaminopimelate ligase n=1 Tax=Skermanella stibiiresistens SB22 TaxID=1385369 RepID=W9GY25_9PROT|nr:UDP-N-acetylmuramoyl-L-alanyl-D-glutamate--2,6-diaminopimelate ligase [Skermanella stibiiresistens]EWY37521.1 UDP-N-acetylmuramoylalanyl-D-glutamate--2,6-diaminopimelate ligase [Skermanella stibiiresistens SB22]